MIETMTWICDYDSLGYYLDDETYKKNVHTTNVSVGFQWQIISNQFNFWTLSS